MVSSDESREEDARDNDALDDSFIEPGPRRSTYTPPPVPDLAAAAAAVGAEPPARPVSSPPPSEPAVAPPATEWAPPAVEPEVFEIPVVDDVIPRANPVDTPAQVYSLDDLPAPASPAAAPAWSASAFVAEAAAVPSAPAAPQPTEAWAPPAAAASDAPVSDSPFSNAPEQSVPDSAKAEESTASSASWDEPFREPATWTLPQAPLRDIPRSPFTPSPVDETPAAPEAAPAAQEPEPFTVPEAPSWSLPQATVTSEQPSSPSFDLPSYPASAPVTMDPITAELPSDELAEEARQSNAAPVWDLSADVPAAAEEVPLWSPVPPPAEDAPVPDSAFDLPSWMAPEEESAAPAFDDNAGGSTTYSLDDEAPSRFTSPVDADPIMEDVPEATPVWTLPVDEPRPDFAAPVAPPAPHVWAMPAAAPAAQPVAPVGDDEPLSPPENTGTPSWMTAPAPSGSPAPVGSPFSYDSPSAFSPPSTPAPAPVPSADEPADAAPDFTVAASTDPRPEPSEIQENASTENRAAPEQPAWAPSSESNSPEFPFASTSQPTFEPPRVQADESPSAPDFSPAATSPAATSPTDPTAPDSAAFAPTYETPASPSRPETSEIQENASAGDRAAPDSSGTENAPESGSPEFPYLPAPVWPESDSLQFSWNSPPPPSPGAVATPAADGAPAGDDARDYAAESAHETPELSQPAEPDSFSRFAPPASRIQENAVPVDAPAPDFSGFEQAPTTNIPEFANDAGGDSGSGEAEGAVSGGAAESVGESPAADSESREDAAAPAPRVFDTPEEQAAFLASYAAPAGKPWIPQRRSLGDDELVSTVGEVANEPGATLDAMDELERQLRLREEDAQEFNDWEESMLAVGTPEAIAAVEEVRPKFEGIPTVTSAISVIPPEVSGYPAPPATELPPQTATHSPLFGEAPYGNARPVPAPPAPVAEPASDTPSNPEPFTPPVSWGVPATVDPDIFPTPDAAAPPAPPASVPAPETQAPVATEPPPLVEPPVTSSTPITSAAPFSWAMPESPAMPEQPASPEATAVPESPATPESSATPEATATPIVPAAWEAPVEPQAPASPVTNQTPIPSTEPHTFPFAFGDASSSPSYPSSPGSPSYPSSAPAAPGAAAAANTDSFDPAQPNEWAAPPSPGSVLTDFPPPGRPGAPPPEASGESAAELTEDPLPFVLPVATPTTGPKNLDDLFSAGSANRADLTPPPSVQSEQHPTEQQPPVAQPSGPSHPNPQSNASPQSEPADHSATALARVPTSPRANSRPLPIATPEESGAEPTPLDHRVGRAARLFWLWFAANSSVIGLAFGGVIFSLGMSLRQSIIATLLGVVLSFIPLGLGTLAGKRGGQPTMIVSRAVFGLRGNIVPAVVAVVSRVFWGAALLWVLAASVSSTIVGSGGAGSLTAGQVLVLALALPFLVAMVVAFFGYALLARFQLVVSVVSGALVVGLILLTIGSIDLPTALTVQDGPIALVLTGAVLVFSFVGLVWANSSADLARYQRPSTSSGASMLWATFGATIPTFLLIAYGALLAASDPAIAAGLRTDPIATFAVLLPSWYPVPLIAAIALSLLSGIVISIYSGGFALQAAGVRLKRQWTVLIAGVLLFIFAGVLTTLVGDLTSLYRDVATTLAVPVAAWVGIFAADTMIRNRRYDSASLLEPGGVYPTVRWVNLAGLVVISLACWGFTTATVGWLSWQGYGFTALGMPRASELAASDFGVLLALVLGLLVPITLGVKAVRRQEASTPGPTTRSTTRSLVAVREAANDRSN